MKQFLIWRGQPNFILPLFYSINFSMRKDKMATPIPKVYALFKAIVIMTLCIYVHLQLVIFIANKLLLNPSGRP